ncbi:hypothetical protein [Streptomyces milbemycinicus]|uniref:hypothetical protein n=1 Tax=Streptomyces milbemycinicus TaxID=476552 RepID=UPI003F4D20EF
MPTTASRPKLVVSCDGHGVVGHTGSRLLADLADLADATGLTAAFTDVLRGCAACSHAAPGTLPAGTRWTSQ